MTAYVSPELERMAARCRLPIRVRYSPLFSRFQIITAYLETDGAIRVRDGWMRGRAEATRAYVALRAELEKA